MTTEELLSKLDNVQSEGDRNDQWNATCPAHDDSQPSLSIGHGDDGRTLLYCQAGCDTNSVLEAIGLSHCDLFEDDRRLGQSPCNTSEESRAPETRKVTESNLGRKVTTYDYRDASGKLLKQVVRTDPKAFRQRRPIENGEWEWSTKGVPEVRYRLPNLLHADHLQWVFFVEGEKDADRLASIELIATTLAGGAKRKLSQEHVTALHALKSRRVAIVPDNDRPGRQYGSVLADALSELSAEIRIVELSELPQKGDVSDWLDTGNDAIELIKLADESATHGPNAALVSSSVDDPDEIAQLVLTKLGGYLYWREDQVEWNGTAKDRSMI